MKYQELILEKEGGVGILTLNRPDKLNALSPAIRKELPQALGEANEDDEIRVLIVTGAGRGFCSGADVSQMPGARADGWAAGSRRELLALVGGEALSVAEFEKPTIAAVNGAAVGAGMSLALLCDIRLAAESARFGALWVRRGLIADWGGTYLLPKVLGVSKALELMYTGDIIDAREAERIGLVSRVVPDAELMKVAKELASKIAKGPPIPMELMKRVVYRDIIRDLTTKLDFESYGQHICRTTEDHKEGVHAFLEKREAHYKGK